MSSSVTSWTFMLSWARPARLMPSYLVAYPTTSPFSKVTELGVGLDVGSKA